MGKNIVENVLLDGGFGVNMTKELQQWLELLKLKPTPYTFWMVGQTITKSIRLIKDLKIQIHGILYIIVIFTVMNNNVLDSNYSMLLGRPWLIMHMSPMIKGQFDFKIAQFDLQKYITWPKKSS